jgi:hypothetical protein
MRSKRMRGGTRSQPETALGGYICANYDISVDIHLPRTFVNNRSIELCWDKKCTAILASRLPLSTFDLLSKKFPIRSSLEGKTMAYLVSKLE